VGVVLAAVRVPLFAGLVFMLVCVLVACGGSEAGSNGSAGTQPDASLPAWVENALREVDGPDVAATMGSQDFAVGENRVVFLVVKEDGSLVQSPRARVHFGRSGGPAETTQAVLQPVGAHEHAHEDVEPHDHLHATDIYVAQIDVSAPGRYWFVADPDGKEIQAIGTLDVAKHSSAPAVGEQAPRSDTPTLADAPAEEITTARPPDTELLRHSIAESVAARVPFVVVFATPEFCVSRVCGPTVEVVERVAEKFAGHNVRFIHVEIYEGNDPDNGFNRWVREWNLPTEPWIFLVDEDGIIRGRFEGAVSVAELTEAVSTELRLRPAR
jgi:hypothetical protein